MSHYLNRSSVALIGAGSMAVDYARVLSSQGVDFSVVGRGAAACEKFTAVTGHPAAGDGLERLIGNGAMLPSTAIVAVGVAELASVCQLLLANGVSRILLEKPGANSLRELSAVTAAAESAGAKVFLAYNRRFYASTRKAREIIAEDGGMTSFTFEFTEWSHQIEKLDTAPAVKQNWFMANSSHVCDLAFFLGGAPQRICSETSGGLPWHSSGAVFAGAGVTDAGVLFSYHANWDSAGRWGLELSTRARRLILRPMERLFETRRGTVGVEEVPLHDDLDTRYKAGLYRQVDAFLRNNATDFLTAADQLRMARDVYARICPSPAWAVSDSEV